MDHQKCDRTPFTRSFPRVKDIAVGDTVRYSRTWLQSTSTHTGDLPRAKGTVTAIKDFGGLKIATIDWDRPDVPERVNVSNLTKVTQRGRTNG